MKRKAYIWIMKILMWISVAITCGLVVFVIGFVLYKGVPNPVDKDVFFTELYSFSDLLSTAF